jgi:hypothetical protein
MAVQKSSDIKKGYRYNTSAKSRENPEALTFRIPKGLLSPGVGKLYLTDTYRNTDTD